MKPNPKKALAYIRSRNELHEAAAALIPTPKPKHAKPSAPVDSGRRKNVKRLGFGCRTQFSFSNQ